MSSIGRTIASIREEEFGVMGMHINFLFDHAPRCPPKNLNLIEQLGFFKPQNSGDDEMKEEKESAAKENRKSTNEDRKFQTRNRRRRDRYSQMRRGRRNRPGTSSRRQNKDDEDEDDFLKPPSAVELELGLELDEISSKGGQKAFANHPVVEMARKRRLFMRRASTILKRPTLLHMLLAEEIRHERNQLMQCVRFVVGMDEYLNDFQCGAPAKVLVYDAHSTRGMDSQIGEIWLIKSVVDMEYLARETTILLFYSR
ncbi:hypothetical protein ACTXT7_003795 [Hymenolepis weldensis]